MEDNILEVKNLKKYYPVKTGFFQKTSKYVKAVDDISFIVKRGRSLAVVGESGSGKTTLANTIMKFESITSGVIYFNGKLVNDISKDNIKNYRRNVQMVFQNPSSSLNPRKTLAQIIKEPLIIHNIGDKESRNKRVAELLSIAELPANFAERYPHTLSGGQKQRVGIARALAINPEFILLDEPTSGLDVSVQAKIIKLLENIQKQYNLTYFFITHDLALVRNFAHDAIVMNEGKIVERGNVDDIFKNPTDSYTRKLIKSVPVVGPEEEAYINSIII
ncbi:MAG: ATP-binding cassette domain-containing protein [Clostridiaceae bacterium]